MKALYSPRSSPPFLGGVVSPLYVPVDRLLGGYPLLQVLIALAFLMAMAFMMVNINNRYNFIRIRTMLPAPLFILMISGFTGMHILHPVWFGALFLLLAVHRLFSAFDKLKPYSAAFDTGFLLGLAILFHFNLYILFFPFLIGMGILSRETGWREIVLVLTGFLLPSVFVVSYAFISDQMQELFAVYEILLFSESKLFMTNSSFWLYVSFLMLLTLLGTIHIIRQYDSKKISTRKFFIVFFLIFVFSVGGVVFIPAISVEMLLIAAIPLSFLTADFFVFMRSRLWGELLFSLFFLIVIVMQFLS